MSASDQIARFVRKIVAPLERRVRLAISRGLVELVDDSTTCQTLQVSLRADELRDDAERFQQFGFTSHPPVGSEVLVLSVAGNTDHPIVAAVEDRATRPTGLAEGESAQYTAQNGKRVYCKSDGSVELGTSPSDFVALAALVDARMTAIETALNNFVTAYNGHGHGGGGTTPPAVPAVPVVPGSSAAATEVKAK